MTQIYTRPFIASLHERSVNYERQPAQYIPREVQKNDTLPSQPEREPEKNTWSQPQPRSPMSDVSKAGEMYQKRPELSQKAPRESLPSLSSLFGSSGAPPRPAQSPFSDGQSPSFPSTSPRDARHPATPMDRPFDSSYFHRPPPPPPQQFTSFNSRPQPTESLGIPPPPPRTVQTTKRPESPQYAARFEPINTSRTQVPPPAWSPRSQQGRQDYFPRDTSSSFRTHDHPPPVHRSEVDSRVVYRDGSHSMPATPSFPPTPASTVAGDAMTGKDGLGPKIWTGTQFLPRFVKQAEVAGEGMCYFYDDGTHCKTVIDGEVVNAHWGVTKAGKPRKRLAIACITCREKKIKCDPDYPRCVQCEKFGRVCKFKNAPRGGQGSPDTPPADVDDVASRPASSRADGESFKSEHHPHSTSVSPRQVLRQASTELDGHSAKRQRNSYHEFTPVPSEGSPQPSVREAVSPSFEPTLSCPQDHELYREWQTNPYLARPTMVSEIVDVFFTQGPETAHCCFPQSAFKQWFYSSREKSLADLMLMYSVLALGSLFSTREEHKALGAQYAAISRFACQNQRLSFQLVQSRLLLSLFYFATNNGNDAWDFCGSAVRAASGLRLNVEIEKSDDAYLPSYPYNLNRNGYAECRRRTFWSCYIIDRFNGFCSGHFAMLHPEDVFLRLPCDSTSFDSQVEVQNPYFDLSTPPIQNHNWTVGSMAYLINIATIWGDVMANIYRSSQRRHLHPSPSTSLDQFSRFYESATHKLRTWNESLPTCYTFNSTNLSTAAANGKLGAFMTMHTVYHTTAMKLNRYIQRSILNPAQLNHHVRVAHEHAEALITIADTLAARPRASPGLNGGRGPSKFSSPYVGYAIVSAIDILTARVPLASVPSRLSSFSGAQSVLAELALFWQSSKNQQALVLERVRDLAELTTGKGGSEVGRRFGEGREGVFEMREAIERTFGAEWDCVYS
ncbi:fungal-specific transcription factor domain-containing protein [Halenospora varia]|nr:fungal-specific transcription factor domain-containing protein [Halenospora varia]